MWKESGCAAFSRCWCCCWIGCWFQSTVVSQLQATKCRKNLDSDRTNQKICHVKFVRGPTAAQRQIRQQSQLGRVNGIESMVGNDNGNGNNKECCCCWSDSMNSVGILSFLPFKGKNFDERLNVMKEEGACVAALQRFVKSQQHRGE